MQRLARILPWLLLALFLALLLLLSVLFVQHQWQQEIQVKQRSSERELQLLASLIHNDLQAGNYQHIDSLIDDWGSNSSDIRQMRVTAASGYLFNTFERPASTDNPVTFTTTINYGYRGAAQLKLVKDFVGVQMRHRELSWNIGVIYTVVSSLLIALTFSLTKYQKKSAALSREVERRRRAETALQSQNDQLEKTVTNRTAQLTSINKELEAFSYSVSHDLRAPLRAIDGFSLALLEDCSGSLNQGCRDYLNRVRNSAQKMGHLIDDLLKLSRVTRSELQLKKINLSLLAENLIEELRQNEPERTVNIAIAPNLWGYGDPTLLQVLLGNLLGNAWKFTRHQPDATIEFNTLINDNNICFFIRDNGVGFDMKYSSKLFNAFQRLHSVEQFEGTGIGLATVQRIITKHGGKVWVDAEVNHGATFYFTLPDSDTEQTM